MQDVIRDINPRLKPDKVTEIVSAIKQYSHAYQLDYRLLAAVIAAESRFNPTAKGKAGEVGLLQLHPKFHLAKSDISANIQEGAKYLSALRNVFWYYNGYTWLEYYNRGPNCVTPRKFPYTKRVLKFYTMFGGISEQATTKGIANTDKRGESKLRRLAATR